MPNVGSYVKPRHESFLPSTRLTKKTANKCLYEIASSVHSFGNISESNNRPVNGNTLFNIDSITKTFTTLALADMVNQGLIKLSDPIEKYLPSNVTVPQFNGIKITIGDLATHTSGLPYIPSNIWINNTIGDLNTDYNLTQMYQALSNTTLTREPGTKF
jgi:D-alanyl-D-alanine-carboxypeptidase/D-alanyl-D-alanine-endopeptidase